MPKKILFINQEITPYVPESEMSLLGKQLPQAMQERGYEIRTFMPKWGTINERRGQLHEVIRLSGMNLIIDDTDHPLIIKVASIPVSRIQVYFIDNEDYFQKRKMVENENGEEYGDNGERAIFFARGVLETVKKAYNDEPSFANTKVVTSLFTKQLKSELGTKFKHCLEFRDVKSSILSGYPNDFSFMELGQLAIDYSDGVIEAGADVNPQLLDYAKSKDLPILPFPGNEEYADAYTEFYNKIIGE